MPAPTLLNRPQQVLLVLAILFAGFFLVTQSSGCDTSNSSQAVVQPSEQEIKCETVCRILEDDLVLVQTYCDDRVVGDPLVATLVDARDICAEEILADAELVDSDDDTDLPLTEEQTEDIQ